MTDWQVKSALALALVVFCGRADAASKCTMCKAAYDGDITAVASALEHHHSPNTRDDNGWTALMDAAGMQHQDVALLLLEHGADVNAKLSDGRDVLYFAAINKEAKLLEAVLDRKVNASERYPDGWTPLLLAAQPPVDTQILEMLLLHHADTNVATPKGVTPLNLVLQDSWDPDKPPPLEAVQLLLANGANPNLSGAGPGWSPIAWAATVGRSHKEILALMIGAGGNPNTLDHENKPILYDALWDDDPSLAYMLLNAGANWKVAVNDNIPLMSVACEKGPELIRALAAHSVDFKWREPGMQNVAADSACWTRENLLALVDQGVYLDAEMPAQGYMGVSPLYAATLQGTGTQVRELMLAGADVPSRAGGDMEMPDPVLLFAATLYSPHKAETYALLDLLGVDMLAKDSDGKTALEVLDAANAKNATDANYLQARKVLEEAMQARRISLGFLFDALDTAVHAPAEEKPAAWKKVFVDGLDLYRKDPGSIEMRGLLMVAASKMTPAPPASQESEQHDAAAQGLYEKAHARSEFLGVAQEYEQAAALAPWVPAYWKNLCTVYELAGAYGRARRECLTYLLSSPTDADAIKAQIKKLQDEAAAANQ